MQTREKLNPWVVEKLKKLDQARSRLYRNQILQVNTRWKALAEIYTMHICSFFKFGQHFTNVWPKFATYVHCVDLGESFPTHIFLQSLDSI